MEEDGWPSPTSRCRRGGRCSWSACLPACLPVYLSVCLSTTTARRHSCTTNELVHRRQENTRTHPPLQPHVPLPHRHLNHGVSHVGHDERAQHHPVEVAEPRQHEGEQHPRAELPTGRGRGEKDGPQQREARRSTEHNRRRDARAMSSGLQQAVRHLCVVLLCIYVPFGMRTNFGWRSHSHVS